MRTFVLAVLLATGVLAAPRSTYRIPAASSRYRTTIVREAHAKGGLTAPVALFAGQLTQESGFNPAAHSGVGAQGLAQFMPQTSTWLTKAAPRDFPTANSLDPEWSIRALVWYDYWLAARLPMLQVGGERWAGALAGYNGGLGYALLASKRGRCAVWFGCAERVDVGRSAANQLQNVQYPDRIIHGWEPLYLTAGWK